MYMQYSFDMPIHGAGNGSGGVFRCGRSQEGASMKDLAGPCQTIQEGVACKVRALVFCQFLVRTYARIAGLRDSVR